MKSLFISVTLLTTLFQCGGTEQPSGGGDKCTVEATVRDFTNKLDGCGFLLELADGSRLTPERRTYVTPPKQEEDPLYFFELKDGDKVKIGYQETSGMDVCMAGKPVFITCITQNN